MDFFVTSHPGAVASHEAATDLVWDWQDAHAGTPDTYDPDSRQVLVWPRVDDHGQGVAVGTYWLHVVISPAGYLQPLDMAWELK